MEDNAEFLLQIFANFADQLPVDGELKDLAGLFFDHLHKSVTGPRTDGFNPSIDLVMHAWSYDICCK